MDDQIIEIAVLNTAEDYRRVLFHLRWKKTVLIAIVYLIIMVPTLWLTMFGAGANPFDAENVQLLIVMVLFGILPLIMIVGFYIEVRRQARKIAKISEKATFLFNEQGVSTLTESSSAQMDWKSFRKIKETENDFIFYPQENIFFIVPKRFYQGQNQIDKLKKLFSEKLRNNAKLKK